MSERSRFYRFYFRCGSESTGEVSLTLKFMGIREFLPFLSPFSHGVIYYRARTSIRTSGRAIFFHPFSRFFFVFRLDTIIIESSVNQHFRECQWTLRNQRLLDRFSQIDLYSIEFNFCQQFYDSIIPIEPKTIHPLQLPCSKNRSSALLIPQTNVKLCQNVLQPSTTKIAP